MRSLGPPRPATKKYKRRKTTPLAAPPSGIQWRVARGRPLDRQPFLSPVADSADHFLHAEAEGGALRRGPGRAVASRSPTVGHDHLVAGQGRRGLGGDSARRQVDGAGDVAAGVGIRERAEVRVCPLKSAGARFLAGGGGAPRGPPKVPRALPPPPPAGTGRAAPAATSPANSRGRRGIGRCRSIAARHRRSNPW